MANSILTSFQSPTTKMHFHNGRGSFQFKCTLANVALHPSTGTLRGDLVSSIGAIC